MQSLRHTFIVSIMGYYKMSICRPNSSSEKVGNSVKKCTVIPPGTLFLMSSKCEDEKPGFVSSLQNFYRIPNAAITKINAVLKRKLKVLLRAPRLPLCSTSLALSAALNCALYCRLASAIELWQRCMDMKHATL